MSKRMISTDVTEEDYRTEPGASSTEALRLYRTGKGEKYAENIYRGGQGSGMTLWIMYCYTARPDWVRRRLAGIVANEMGVNIKITSGPAIEKPGEMAAILNNLQEGDVLFVDEIHRLNRQVEEVLYPAMEDFCD